jgi:prevent-host-death family protein
MARRHSIAEARTHLPSLVKAAESGKTVELTRRGEPVAVLIGRRQFLRLTSKRARFTDAYERFAKAFDLASLALDPDEIFRAARDEIRGREVRV